jgi:hypothetical protein
VITGITYNGSGAVISGTLNSTPNTAFTLEFFSSNTPSAASAEGEEFLGSAAVTTNAAGDATFSVTFPARAGEFITATATDPGGNTSEFSAARRSPPIMLPPSLATAPRIGAYSQTFTLLGAIAPVTWSATGLPSGLSINSTTGLLSGTLNLPSCASLNFAVQATEATVPPQVFPRNFTMTVAGTIAITTAALNVGVTMENYSSPVNAVCGSGPRTWTLTGALPVGLSFGASAPNSSSSFGSWAGGTAQPRQNGTFPVTIQVTDSSGSDSRNLTLNVLAVDQQVLGGGATATAIGGTSRIAQTMTVGASGTLMGVRGFAVSPVAPATTCPVLVSL